MGHEASEFSPGADVLPRPPSPPRRGRRSSVDSRDPRAPGSIGLRNNFSAAQPTEVSFGGHNHDGPQGQVSAAPRDDAGLSTRARAPAGLEEDLAGMPAAWRGQLKLERPRPAIAIALIGGQCLLREATASLLTAQDGLHVLGTFACPEEFMATSFAAPPAVLLLDGDAGHGECAAALEQLRAAPGVRG